MKVRAPQRGREQGGAAAGFVREMLGPIGVVGLFSLLISLLILAQPLYMMNLFDRVLTSMSEDTLVALTLITVFLMVGLGFLEAARSRALVRVGARFDEVMGGRVFNALIRANIQQKVGGTTLGQVDQVRNFVTGQGLIAFFDLPFAPVFLLVMFLLHPWLGVTALVSSLLVVGMTLVSRAGSRRASEEGAHGTRMAGVFAENALRSSETVAAMGMIGVMRERWLKDHRAAAAQSVMLSERVSDINAAMKGMMMIVPIVIMAVACYLVIHDQATPGALFAANVLAMRIIAPLQGAVGALRGLFATREAIGKIDELLAALPEEDERLKLPRPRGHLVVDKLLAGAPGGDDPIIHGVSFQVLPGQALGIIGPSASGKTSLSKMLVGLWKPMRGHIRLDGADLHSWEFDNLGPYIGYLSQDIDLFNGTVAENISRFGARDDEAVIAAAKEVGIHEAILQLPKGYDTPIKGKGGVLSGGQRQRIGLARAIYGDPQMLVLDEPNSNLDGDGEKALLQLIERLKAKGRTLVVIAHNPRILQNMDKILYLKHGKVTAYGKREDVLGKLRILPAPGESGPVMEDDGIMETGEAA